MDDTKVLNFGGPVYVDVLGRVWGYCPIYGEEAIDKPCFDGKWCIGTHNIRSDRKLFCDDEPEKYKYVPIEIQPSKKDIEKHQTAIAQRKKEEEKREKIKTSIIDKTILEPTIKSVLEKRNEDVLRYKSGKTVLLQSFLGDVMKQINGNPDIVKEMLLELLS